MTSGADSNENIEPDNMKYIGNSLLKNNYSKSRKNNKLYEPKIHAYSHNCYRK